MRKKIFVTADYVINRDGSYRITAIHGVKAATEALRRDADTQKDSPPHSKVSQRNAAPIGQRQRASSYQQRRAARTSDT